MFNAFSSLSVGHFRNFSTIYPVAPLFTDSSFRPLRQGLVENAIKAALQDLTITPIDAARIQEFIAELRSCKNISPDRSNKLSFTLIT
jgi:hypothetical protein